MSRHHKAGENHNTGIANRSFEHVQNFKYLGTTVTNQNLIHEEIKSRQNSGNACYHSLQNILPSRLYKNIKGKTKKDIVSPVLN
jgi:hypothetical protein